MRHTENPPGSPPGGFSMNAPVSRLGGPSSGNPASVTVNALLRENVVPVAVRFGAFRRMLADWSTAPRATGVGPVCVRLVAVAGGCGGRRRPGPVATTWDI